MVTVFGYTPSSENSGSGKVVVVSAVLDVSTLPLAVVTLTLISYSVPWVNSVKV